MGMHNVRHHALRFCLQNIVAWAIILDYSDVPDPRFRYRENISQVTVAKTRNDGDGGNKGKRL